jgi:hypothetical protein
VTTTHTPLREWQPYKEYTSHCHISIKVRKASDSLSNRKNTGKKADPQVGSRVSFLPAWLVPEVCPGQEIKNQKYM